MKKDSKPTKKSTAKNSGRKNASSSKVVSSKKMYTVFQTVLVILVIIIIAMYILDIPPLDFDINDLLGKADGNINNPINSQAYTKQAGDLAVHFVDVGQGDCIIIQFPDGKNMIIDGGDRASSIRTKVLNYIGGLSITNFDYLMLTHTDADHCGSLDDVVASQNIYVSMVFMPYIKSSYANDPLKDSSARHITTVVYSDFVKAVVEEGSQIVYSVRGLKITSEKYQMTLYTPMSMSDYDKTQNAANINAVSPIMVLEYAGREIMFTGDANEITEKWFVGGLTLNDGLKNVFNIDALKVGHHGSSSSTTQEFLDIIAPKYAVISVGTGNSYGHPSSAAINRLEKVNGFGGYARTDINGDIIYVVRSSGDTLWNYQKQAGTASISIIKFFSPMFFGVFVFISKDGNNLITKDGNQDE